MDEFTAEQKDQLKTWSEKRDDSLLEIQKLKIITEKLETKNKELSVSNSDIESRMKVTQGRIIELKKVEKDVPKVISKEIAVMKTEKTRIESEIQNLEKILRILEVDKDSIDNDIEKSLHTFNIVKSETLLLGKVVDKVTSTSEENARKINLLVSNLAASLEDIVSVNKKNVYQTNIVIEKLPAIIMELQRKGLIKNRQTIIKSKK